MAVWIPWARVLVAGDYLSPVEIPMLSETGSASAYLATLDRLEPLVEQADHVVPGHGEPIDGTRAAAILREDRAYLEALLERGDGGEAADRAPLRRPAQDPRREREQVSARLLHELTPELRALGERMLAAALERLAADPPELGRELPPDELAALAGACVTPDGLGPQEALRRFRDVLLPLTVAIDHPRYFAFIPSAPTAASAFVELLLSAHSVYGGTWLEGAGAVHAENEALRWLAGPRRAARRRRRLLRPGRHQRQPVGAARRARACAPPARRRDARALAGRLQRGGALLRARRRALHGRRRAPGARRRDRPDARGGAAGRARGGRRRVRRRRDRRHHQRRPARRPRGHRGGLPRARRVAARRRRLRGGRPVRAGHPRPLRRDRARRLADRRPAQVAVRAVRLVRPAVPRAGARPRRAPPERRLPRRVLPRRRLPQPVRLRAAPLAPRARDPVLVLARRPRHRAPTRPRSSAPWR